MSNIRKTIVTNCEKKFLIKCLAEWTRIDGRAFDEFRKFDIKFGKDWGCCYVSLGKTKVVAQVSAEIQAPKSSRPSEGILNVNIELNPIAAPHFEAGRQSDLSVQLNRLLEKCLKDSKAVDLESLCIKMNEKVWALRVDVNVLNHEGNILDCASVAALAALAHFRRADVTCDGEEFIIHSYKQRDPIPMVIHHYPVCVTYSIFSGGDFILADPTLLEEGVADAFLTVGLNAYKELCGLHLGGKAELTPELILQTTNKAANHAGRVVQQIKDAVLEDNKIREENKYLDFHKTIIEDNVFDTTELSQCLDRWTVKNKKSKKKSGKNKDDEFLAQVEAIGRNTASLVPMELGDGDETKEVWQVESDDAEEDNDVIMVPPPKVETIDIDGDGSEEETVVVLKGNASTNKKKKVKK